MSACADSGSDTSASTASALAAERLDLRGGLGGRGRVARGS